MGKIFADRISKLFYSTTLKNRYRLKVSLIFVTECACATRDVEEGRKTWGGSEK